MRHREFLVNCSCKRNKKKKCNLSQPVYCRVTSQYKSDTAVNLQIYRSMEDSSRPINSPPVSALLIYCTIKRVIPLGATATVNEVMLNSSPWIYRSIFNTGWVTLHLSACLSQQPADQKNYPKLSWSVLSFFFCIFLTFIISTMVLRAIMARTVYSKDGDTTKCHRRYWKVWRFWGM